MYEMGKAEDAKCLHSKYIPKSKTVSFIPTHTEAEELK